MSKVTQGPSDGYRGKVWDHPYGPRRPRRVWGGQHFRKAVAEVTTVEIFVFYVIIKIIIMPTHLPLDACRRFEYCYLLLQLYIYIYIYIYIQK